MQSIQKDRQYYKFCFYGFLKNLRFFDAFLLLFLADKGITFTQIGILYATREVVINIFEIPSGIVADSLGRRNALAGSLLIYLFSFVVFYFFHDFGWFMLAFILYGIGDAFRTGTHKGMIMDYLKSIGRIDQRISYYGHTRSWSQKGSAVSALVAGIIVFISGNYENIFLLSTFPYVLNFLLILSYPAFLNKTPGEKAETYSGALKNSVKSLVISLKQPQVLRIINTSALHTAYLQAVKDYIQPMMMSVALLLPVFTGLTGEKTPGLLVGVMYFFIYLLTSYASKKAASFEARAGKNVSFYTLMAGLFFGMVTGTFYSVGWSIPALLFFTGIYIIENIRKPILTGFVADNVPGEILSSVISVQSQLKTVMTAALAFFTGLFADYFGVGVSFILISGVLLFASLLLNFAFAKLRIKVAVQKEKS